jgi:ABC-2 type transport system ATP-binding protein
MDVLSARRVMENLRLLARRGKTIFLTSHILEIVEKICDEVAIIAHGQTVWQQALQDLPADASLERIFLDLSSGAQRNPQLSWAK